MPCDSSTRILELLVFFDQYWAKHNLPFPICLMSRTGREMLTFVRSMLEWLGGTINKEDVGAEERRRGGRRGRDEDDEAEDALGPLSLRFKFVHPFLSQSKPLISFQTLGVLLESTSSLDDILVSRPQTDPRCACLSVTWSFALAFLQLRCCP
jgi:Cft2 family RNA processing exonuclease